MTTTTFMGTAATAALAAASRATTRPSLSILRSSSSSSPSSRLGFQTQRCLVSRAAAAAPSHRLAAASSFASSPLVDLRPNAQPSLTTLRSNNSCRTLSTSPPVSPPLPNVTPPSSLTYEVAMGVQDALTLYIRHGLGKQRLDQIASDTAAVAAATAEHSFVSRWQRMMETFLGVQVHVLAGLGYPPDAGLASYNVHLAQLMQSLDPDQQETLRIKGRDVWREVMCSAFGVNLEDVKEVGVVDARNVMHKVSQRMIEPDMLESVSKQCASTPPKSEGEGEGATPANVEVATKHMILQQVLFDMYLKGTPSLVQECGFGEGETGYVLMQCSMADHQNDPLVAQYVGSAMMSLMQAAGIDAEAMQKAAAAAQADMKK